MEKRLPGKGVFKYLFGVLQPLVVRLIVLEHQKRNKNELLVNGHWLAAKNSGRCMRQDSVGKYHKDKGLKIMKAS